MAYRNVTIAVDGSDDSDAILAALEGVFTPATRVGVVTVVPDLALEFFDVNERAREAGWPVNEIQAAIVEQASRKVKSHAALYGIAPEHVSVLHGDPAEQLCGFCKASATDLLVMGIRSRKHGTLGSTATDLLYTAPCDVLTVRV